MSKKNKLVKRFKGRSRTQQILFLGMGLVFLLVVGSFAGLFGTGTHAMNGGTAALTKSLIPRDGADYEYNVADVTIRASASIYPAGHASITEFTVFFWKEGSTPRSIYHLTWTASQNELSEVFQDNKGKLATGIYNVRFVVTVSEVLIGGQTQEITNQFTVSEAPQIQFFEPELNEIIEITATGIGASANLPIAFNAIEGSNSLVSITAKTDSNSGWSESSNFQKVTYKPTILIKATAAEDGMTTGHYLYITLKDSVGNTVIASRSFNVKWTYVPAGGAGFEAPSFTWLLTILVFILLYSRRKR